MKTKLQSLTEKYKSATDKNVRDNLRYQIEGEIITILSSTIDRYYDHLKEIVSTVSIIMGAQRVSLLVRKGNFLEIAASHGLPESVLLRNPLIRIGSGIAGQVAQTGQPIFTGDLTRDEELKQKSIGGGGFKSNAFICLPLKFENNVLGVINVSNPVEGTSFKKSDFSFLQKIAEKISLLLHKSMKFESMMSNAQSSEPSTASQEKPVTHMNVIKETQEEQVVKKKGPPPLPPSTRKKPE